MFQNLEKAINRNIEREVIAKASSFEHKTFKVVKSPASTSSKDDTK